MLEVAVLGAARPAHGQRRRDGLLDALEDRGPAAGEVVVEQHHAGVEALDAHTAALAAEGLQHEALAGGKLDRPRALKVGQERADTHLVARVRDDVSGTIRTRVAVGQTRSSAVCMACTHRGRKAGLRLLKPAGKRFVSTGASLKPALRRSTEA